MGMLLRRHRANKINNNGVAEKVAPKVVEKAVEEIKEETKYTKTEINRKSTSELRVIAKDLGIEKSELMTGSELKKILIEKMGL